MAGMDGGAGAPGAGASARLDAGGAGAASAGVQARAKRDYVRRAYAQKVAMVQRACRRIEAGSNLSEVCREADMPGRTTVVAWLARHPELRAMMEAAEAVAAEEFTPRRDYHYWDEDVAAEVLARIEDGKGLCEVCAERDMPAACTVTRWLNERPEFAVAYRRAREAQLKLDDVPAAMKRDVEHLAARLADMQAADEPLALIQQTERRLAQLPEREDEARAAYERARDEAHARARPLGGISPQADAPERAVDRTSTSSALRPASSAISIAASSLAACASRTAWRNDWHQPRR